MSAVSVRRWSAEEWLRSEAAWDALVARSRADALFLSWHWLTHWWRYYGGSRGTTLEILGCYRDAQLIGIAPLYRRAVVRGGFVPASSVQLIGLSWRDPVPLISEYLDVIASPEDLPAVRSECLRTLLARRDWSELVVGFTAAGAEWRAACAREAASARQYTRELDRSVSYHADLGDGFPAYLKALGQSTRRSVWNLRRRLTQEHGEVRFELIGPEELDGGFDDLNRLHQLRWQRPAFAAERLRFHKAFAKHLSARGELAFTRLRVAGEVVSVLYDIRKGARQYNMKMGFDPSFTTRLSVGLIHFGYAMEAAAERGATLYDFLAGPGQSFDFKRNLGRIQRPLSCVQMLRGPILPALFRWRDRIRLAHRIQHAAQPASLGESGESAAEHGD